MLQQFNYVIHLLFGIVIVSHYISNFSYFKFQIIEKSSISCHTAWNGFIT